MINSIVEVLIKCSVSNSRHHHVGISKAISQKRQEDKKAVSMV